MATVDSTTFPGTELQISIIEIPNGLGTAYDVNVCEAGVGSRPRPRRFAEFEQFASVLGEAGLITDEIEGIRRTLATTGKVDISDLWLLDDQAARLGINVIRQR